MAGGGKLSQKKSARVTAAASLSYCAKHRDIRDTFFCFALSIELIFNTSDLVI
jgi:hypothetical protein